MTGTGFSDYIEAVEPPGDDAEVKPQDPEAFVRATLGEWARRVAGDPAADFGQTISIVALRDRTAYAGFLRCLFDVRGEPVDKALAFKEGAVPRVADRADLWSLPVRLTREFVEQEELITAADPGDPIECNRCSGENGTGVCETCHGSKTAPCQACLNTGRRSCPACAGRGRIACTLCAGSGRVLNSVAQDGALNQDVCPQCAGAKEFACADCADAAAPDCARCSNTRVTPCPACEGRGAPLCAQCGGTRRIVRGFSVQVAYLLAYYRSLVRDPGVPEEVFPANPPTGKLGETVFEQEGDDAALAAQKPADAAGEAFARALALVPAAGLGPRSRRILQSLSIEKIPIFEIVYAFEGKEYRAWVGRYQNRVVALDDPFAELASRRAAEAAACLEKGDLAAFEERAAQAAALAPSNTAVVALRASAGAFQRRAAVRLGLKLSAAAAVAVPVVLSLLYQSPNRYIPLAALGLAILAASSGAVLWAGARLQNIPLLSARRRGTHVAAAAAAGAVLIAGAFAAAAPIRRIDTREFDKRLSTYAALPLESWRPDDDTAVASLIDDYTPRGVDTGAAQDLRERYASFVAAARAQALRDAQTRRERERRAREAARVRAEWERAEAARRARAAAAEKLAAKRRAAKKRAAKKKKRKKSKR